jgi:N-acetylmuramic acid 6-phosphate etherase
MIENTNQDLMHLSSVLEDLASEMTNDASERLDAMSPLEIATLMNQQDHLVATSVEKVLEPIALAITAAAKSLRAGGRIVYIGAGTSGRLGVLDASECRPTFSAPEGWVVALIAGGPDAMFRALEGAEDDIDQGALDVAEIAVSDTDTVIGLAASGRTPYVLGGLAEARCRGAVTVGVSCNDNSPLEANVDIAITPVVGPEVLTGSTRLKSATAQKMVLNMISTGAMVRIGKCYGNRMVDLSATNEKLQARALNLVCELTPATKRDALRALVAADWDIKVAILTGKTGQSVQTARALILASNGHLRRALETVATA